MRAQEVRRSRRSRTLPEILPLKWSLKYTLTSEEIVFCLVLKMKVCSEGMKRHISDPSDLGEVFTSVVEYI